MKFKSNNQEILRVDKAKLLGLIIIVVHIGLIIEERHGNIIMTNNVIVNKIPVGMP